MAVASITALSGTSTSAPATSTIDTTAASYVVVTGTDGHSGDTVTIKDYRVVLVP